MGLYQNSRLLGSFWLCVIALVYIGLACVPYGETQKVDEEPVLNMPGLGTNKVDSTFAKTGKGVGDNAPHFRLELVNGTVVDLPGLLTRGPVILYFFTSW